MVFAMTGRTQEKTTVTAAVNAQSGHILDKEAVTKLLTRPPCFASQADTLQSYVIKDCPVPSNGISLSAQLYLPLETGKWPLVILIPGGFNETELIMQAPRYYAPLLARCGIAALVYYKRGTGPSGGVYAEATNDDFINDVVSIAKELAGHADIDSTRIGLVGGSGGPVPENLVRRK
jgi:predicted acyl esterase